MESSTAAAAPSSTGSTTIADLMGLASERYADLTAVKYKSGDDWVDVSYRELGTIVSEVARGLIDLGLEPGDRAAVLCSTRPEWTYASFGIASAGAVVVPIYPTNSPEECEWVAGNSESRFLFAEDAEQAAKIAEVRDRLPNLEAVIVMVGDAPDAIRMDDLRERGRGRDHAEVAAQHHRPPHVLGRHAGRPGDRVDHDALQRALAQLADQQLAQEPLLRRGRAGEQLSQQGPAGRLRPGPGLPADLVERRVDRADPQGRRVRRGRHLAQRGPADTDLPLPKLAGEERDRRGRLVGVGPAEHVGEQSDLAKPRGRAGHRRRRVGQVPQQHGHAGKLAEASDDPGGRGKSPAGLRYIHRSGGH